VRRAAACDVRELRNEYTDEPDAPGRYAMHQRGAARVRPEREDNLQVSYSDVSKVDTSVEYSEHIDGRRGCV